MYLKRMELQGFKSFADKTILEFKPGITAVIGPNGSGKSNISDSIRWVLGEQSMKSLRGQKSEDIIFAGTQSRKSLGFAEVSIIIDNQDGKLPIEYTEVTVTRKIYRSGETGYFINKTPCRLKDILELFMDTGIGKDGYSIVGQGKIDEILSNKSEDRRNIFEEAAGIVKYRSRRHESEKKLEQTKLNLIRINDILSEIESTIDPLRLQAEKARQFLDLREELKQIEVGLFLYNIEKYKEKLEEMTKDEEIFNNQKIDETEKLTTMQNLREALRSELEQLNNEIERIQNIGFESKNMIEKINSDINVANERISNNNENVIRLEDEVIKEKERITKLEEEKKAKVEKKTNLSRNREKFEKELEEKEKALEKVTKKLSGKELEIEEKKKEIEKDTDIKYEIINQISIQDTTYENHVNREKVLKNELSSGISELDHERTDKNELMQGFGEVEVKRNNLKQRLEDMKEQKTKHETKLSEFDNEIAKLIDENRMKTSRYNFLVETEREKEGYTKSVKSLLIECENNSELRKGMHGVLANLVSSPKEYEVALEMCLGASLQNIVTNTETDAKKLIEHLRKNNIGRASFLPISGVKGNKLARYNQKGLDGVIGIAADLVKYDKKYEQIVLNLLGRTVIVEDMDTAIALAKQNQYSFRIVTTNGDLINPSGLMTGGAVAKKTVNILGRGREIEDLQKQIKKLEKKIQETKEEKEEYILKNSEMIEEIELAENNLQEYEVIYAKENEKVMAATQAITKVENRVNKIKAEIEELKVKKENCLKEKETLEKQIEELTSRIEALNKEVEKFALLNKDDQKYIDDLNFDITNLKISVSSFDESDSSIDEMVERIDQDIQNAMQAITNKEKQTVEFTDQNKALEKEITDAHQKIKDIESQVENSNTKYKEYKEERTLKNEKLEKTEKEIEGQFGVIEEIKNQLTKIEMKKVNNTQDMEQIINQLWDEYEVTPNHATEFEKPKNVQATQKQVNELHNKIKDLGSINIDSIEEYKKNKERYDFMCEQRLDLENSIAKLRDIISDMTSTMKKQFTDKFYQINKNFNDVFAELFGGGKAELVLEDENNILECGIDIKAQPPGKKLQNMSLLSGGERALTAIAILFAILKINPAPFCILDEIEAALDDVNVYRFADYLKKFNEETQFLVITHRKGTMEASDTVYGVTMEENGISKLLSMKLNKA